ncbi:MAG: sugar ABC transporter permease [Chloroflexia bacterium]|nr:sugar ABC transporter permease [Chloroflexia bacterium]MDQ3412506.1 sugar ABC transporter permease [Chloroflexota bacterium]
MATSNANQLRPPRFSPRLSDETRAGWLSITPWIIGFLVFTLGPLLASLYFSFTNYDVLTPPEWIGLDNYAQLLTADRLFPRALQNTLIYAVLYVPLHIVTALGVAMLLERARHLKGIFRTIFYLPAITPAVATAYLWIWILNPNDGLVNQFLRSLGIPAPAWTVDPFWVKPTIVIPQIWILGGAMIIFLAGLKGIPRSLYEAAILDGAGPWRRFRDVTLPMLSSVTFFVATVSTISALQVFTQGYVMYDANGGPENSALFVVMYLFKRAFDSGYFQMGYASAIAWVLFLLIVAVTIVQFRLSKKWVYYEAGTDG